MSLINVINNIQSNHTNVNVRFKFLIKNILYLPRQQNIAIQTAINWEPTNKNATSKHRNKIQSCRNDGHIRTYIYKIIITILNLFAPKKRYNRRN